MGNVAVMKTTLTDNELMQLFADQDDQVAFERLYHKYKEPLLRFSYGYTFNQARAEEIVHETFLKVYRHKKSYDPKKTFRTWLWTICKNTNLDALEKLPRGREESLDEKEMNFESQDESVLERLINESTKEDLIELVHSLPDSQRDALLLWMNDDLSFDEMGSILEKSPQAVKNLVHRAKLGLKEKLGEKK